MSKDDQGESNFSASSKAGRMPAWRVADMPSPPAWTLRNVLRIVGPGTIALSVSIGAGEWILGPRVTVEHGLSMLWIVTLAVLFQLACNLQFIRYTVYTGEPIINGFMRTSPGPVVWGTVYILLALCQMGWPAWAATSAAPLFTAISGRLPTDQDSTAVLLLGVSSFILAVGIVGFGGKVERMLEVVNWFMVTFIFSFLLVVCVLFVPPHIWWEGLIGFLGLTPEYEFQFVPASVAGRQSWLVLGGFAAFAAAGGMANLMTSNWVRDKGFGMGSLVGYIPSAVGGKKVRVSPVGTVFPVTTENLKRWKGWWRYVLADQAVIWAVGCFVGMYLNCILAVAVMPANTEMEGLAAGAFQADFLRAHAGDTLAFLGLLNGFWILFGSQLVITDGFVRVSTDILWSGSSRVRRWAQDDIRRVYYTLIIAFAVWGAIAINLARPDVLVLIAANSAGFILMFAAFHGLVLNHRFLPREVRAPLWQQAGVVGTILFYAMFFIQNLRGG